MMMKSFYVNKKPARGGRNETGETGRVSGLVYDLADTAGYIVPSRRRLRAGCDARQQADK
jgi:hypothetical protein